MKNQYKALLVLLISLALFPQITLASWWNPTTWFNQTSKTEVKDITRPTVSNTPVVLKETPSSNQKVQPTTSKSLPKKASSAPSVLNNSQIISKVKPAVVYIETEEGAGSGMIVESNSSASYILTNAHVIEGFSKVSVTLSDGDLNEAIVVGRNEKLDLALLKIDQGSLSKVQFGDSGSLSQGDNVFALGYPFGIKGDASFTAGVVSRIWNDYIEMSVQIHPGNSGGPLINQYGQIIGINTLSYSTKQIKGVQVGETLKFAIPINIAKNIIASLKKGQNVASDKAKVPTKKDITEADKKYCETQGEVKYKEYLSSVQNGLPADSQIAQIDAQISEARARRDQQISQIRSTYASQIASMQNSYSSMEAAQRQIDIRNGTSRYMPSISSGNSAAVQQQSSQAISSLQSQEQMYISQIDAVYQTSIAKYEALKQEIIGKRDQLKKDDEKEAQNIKVLTTIRCLADR